jgi:hypothetical protein
MFESAGLTFSDLQEDFTATADPRPVEYVVRKDGKPFAILNATPELARRTVSGFALAAPQAAWSMDRI